MTGIFVYLCLAVISFKNSYYEWTAVFKSHVTASLSCSQNVKDKKDVKTLPIEVDMVSE